MSNMNRRSLDPEGKHVSPLGRAGEIHVAYEAIQVRLLYWPEEKVFKQMVYKAITATRGNTITEDIVDEKVVEDAFAGGLNQCLEWVTVVFEINGVSRGLTHELVRTRKASFAQQSMRHTDMGTPAMRMPEFIASAAPLERAEWIKSIHAAQEAYGDLVRSDMPYQDARTVLPIATETYIIGAYPLSEFLNTYGYRACYMFYPEMVWLFREMRRVLLEKCNWLAPYILVSCEKTRPNGPNAHMCTYQGWEAVEGHCPLAWAKEDNRVWKSRRYGAEGQTPPVPLDPTRPLGIRALYDVPGMTIWVHEGRLVVNMEERVLWDGTSLSLYQDILDAAKLQAPEMLWVFIRERQKWYRLPLSEFLWQGVDIGGTRRVLRLGAFEEVPNGRQDASV